MRRHWILRAAGVLAGLTIASVGAQAAPGSGGTTVPADAEIRKVLAERVDALAGKDDGIGIVVGVVGPRGRRIVPYGHRDRGDPRPLDGDTVFEIGSVTKVFTALLLADMAGKGEVALADPVAKYLPAATIPERNGRSITLLDLATHTSGLPFMPDALPALDDPAASTYGPAQIDQFVARYRLPRDIGSGWDYSNIGYWLLGKALASRAGTDYGSLLRKRVIAPLHLTRTAVSPSPLMNANLAVGHTAELQPSASLSTLPGYASMLDVLSLVSTTDDLLTFLSVAMGHEKSPLAPAMNRMLGTHRPMPHPGEAQALGWVVIGDGDDQFIVHDGGTLGFASSVAWDPRRRIGVVVLSNHVAGVGDIARHLLRSTIPLERPTATRHTEIALEPAVLDKYAGRYEATGEGTFVVTREKGFLTIEAPADWGLPRLRLHPENARDFFATELPLRVTFQTGDDGRVRGMLVHPPRGQDAVPAIRMSADE